MRPELRGTVDSASRLVGLKNHKEVFDEFSPLSPEELTVQMNDEIVLEDLILN